MQLFQQLQVDGRLKRFGTWWFRPMSLPLSPSTARAPLGASCCVLQGHGSPIFTHVLRCSRAGRGRRGRASLSHRLKNMHLALSKRSWFAVG